MTLYVTAKDDVDIMEKLITKLFDPYPEGEEKTYIDAFRELFQIVAWMPLPKFYDKYHDADGFEQNGAAHSVVERPRKRRGINT